MGGRGPSSPASAPSRRRCSSATPPRTLRSSSATTTRACPRTPCAAAFVHATVRDPVLRSCSQAGLVNNLNDALAWGLAPLFLAAPWRQRQPDRDRRRRLSGRVGRRPARHRLAQRPHRPKTPDHKRNAPPSGRPRHPGGRQRRVPTIAPGRLPARRGHGNGVPNPDRRGLGRQPAARPRPRGQGLPLLARLRLRAGRPSSQVSAPTLQAPRPPSPSLLRSPRQAA